LQNIGSVAHRGTLARRTSALSIELQKDGSDGSGPSHSHPAHRLLLVARLPVVHCSSHYSLFIPGNTSTQCFTSQLCVAFRKVEAVVEKLGCRLFRHAVSWYKYKNLKPLTPVHNDELQVKGCGPVSQGRVPTLFGVSPWTSVQRSNVQASRVDLKTGVLWCGGA
jgi:hypothetical protein